MDDLASEAGTSDLGWLSSIGQQRDVNAAVPPSSGASLNCIRNLKSQQQHQRDTAIPVFWVQDNQSVET